MLFDTSAWIDYFEGSGKKETIEYILENEENFTSIVTLAEISNWFTKNNSQDKIKAHIEGIKKASQLVDINEEISALAGELNFLMKKIEKNWGMMDSFILATSLMFNLRVLTKDKHFADLPNAEMLQS